MKVSKSADRAQVARLRAAGLTVQEIGQAVGISKQRVSQILASEPVPTVGRRATIYMDAIESDTDPRVIHAAIVRALNKLGIEVETRTRED